MYLIPDANGKCNAVAEDKVWYQETRQLEAKYLIENFKAKYTRVTDGCTKRILKFDRQFKIVYWIFRFLPVFVYYRLPVTSGPYFFSRKNVGDRRDNRDIRISVLWLCERACCQAASTFVIRE